MFIKKQMLVKHVHFGDKVVCP